MIRRRVDSENNDVSSVDDTVNANQKSNMRFRLVTLLCVVYVFLSLFLRIFAYDMNTVSGSSMSPTLTDKDVLLTETAVLNDLQRYDIVTIDVNDDIKGKIRIIKRVIGLPGEHITIYTNGMVAIDGEFLPDEYQIDCYESDGAIISTDVILSDDEYYVLGDNRYNSADSRLYGPFSIDKIKGKVIFRLFPFKSAGKLSNIKMED